MLNMKFIVLLFAVLLQKQTKQTGYSRNRAWFQRLASPFNVMDMGVYGQGAVFGLLVLLPSLLLALVMVSLTGLIGGAIGLIVQVVLFLYVLGRDDFSLRFESYKACWSRADYQGAFNCASQFLTIEDQVDSQTPCQLHQMVKQAIVYAWFKRFFVFVFWFLVAGISGAMGVLLTYWFYREFKLTWLNNLLAALEWLPVRLLALTTALAGDFTRSFAVALKFALDFQSSSKTVLLESIFSGSPADKEPFDCDLAEESLTEANQLMFRCAVLWLLVVALLTLFGGLN